MRIHFAPIWHSTQTFKVPNSRPLGTCKLEGLPNIERTPLDTVEKARYSARYQLFKWPEQQPTIVLAVIRPTRCAKSFAKLAQLLQTSQRFELLAMAFRAAEAMLSRQLALSRSSTLARTVASAAGEIHALHPGL